MIVSGGGDGLFVFMVFPRTTGMMPNDRMAPQVPRLTRNIKQLYLANIL